MLNSTKAVNTGVHVVRAFVKLRELMRSNRDIEQRFNPLEKRVTAKLGAHDRAIVALIKSLRELTAEPAVKRRSIGFVYPKE